MFGNLLFTISGGLNFILLRKTAIFNMLLIILSMISLCMTGYGAPRTDHEKIIREALRRTEFVYHPSKSSENKNLENVSMKKAVENKTEEIIKSDKFYVVLDDVLQKRGLKRKDVCDETDPVQHRILREYGAIFLTAESVMPPPSCMFTSVDEVAKFQEKAGIQSENVNEAVIELQPKAMKALLEAREEARSQNLDITPRDGAEAARRGFEDTLRLWNSRFEPACEHWKLKGRLSVEQVERLKSLPVKDQVKEVLELEKRGIYFNTWFNNSILYSVAAPGTSQHLSMLAFDANEFGNAKVRKILANHGWFRTVKNDTPHFTYLGVKESDLKNMGLKKIKTGDGDFWVPNV